MCCCHPLVCAFLSLPAYLLQFTTSQSRAWVTASLVSFASDALLMEPISLFVKVLRELGFGIAKTVAKPGDDRHIEHVNAPPTRPDAYKQWLAEEERLKREGKKRPTRKFRLRKQYFIDALAKSLEE